MTKILSIVIPAAALIIITVAFILLIISFSKNSSGFFKKMLNSDSFNRNLNSLDESSRIHAMHMQMHQDAHNNAMRMHHTAMNMHNATIHQQIDHSFMNHHF